ncbi:MAG: hypothetical protein KatS3mg050_0009 [Litorilinea sp.]|nr:MAG: hypothetical protein KatS3mg050_0009 [Litorilinea sp.]
MSSMLTQAQFVAEVHDAYQHLYDVVYLRTHPLADRLIPEPQVRRKEKAWRIHRILLEVIDELDPGEQAPVFSREWRRHRLMVLRYVDGLDPQAVADELAISRRHFYREQDAAIEAVASILWNRYVEPSRPGPVNEPESDRLTLLRHEVARLEQRGRHSRLNDVLEGAIQLVKEMARQKGIQMLVDTGAEREDLISISPHILRQILLDLASYLVEKWSVKQVTVKVQGEHPEVTIHLYGDKVSQEEDYIPSMKADLRFSMVSELARLQQARLEATVTPEGLPGFVLQLPTTEARTLLIVDDNEDIQQLFRRYLHGHPYRAIAVQDSRTAVDMAARLQPFAIILDLMLPDIDGWDLLQTLTNRPETHQIPVIICTVLSARELALSLGAAAFLEKPITEEKLLTALEQVATSAPAQPAYPPSSAE